MISGLKNGNSCLAVFEITARCFEYDQINGVALTSFTSLTTRGEEHKGGDMRIGW
jgi:hypothetical protein